MSIDSRLKRIEKKLGVGDKSPWLKLPDGNGGFIEVPGCRTLIDAIALAQARRHRQKPNETGRN